MNRRFKFINVSIKKRGIDPNHQWCHRLEIGIKNTKRTLWKPSERNPSVIIDSMCILSLNLLMFWTVSRKWKNKKTMWTKYRMISLRAKYSKSLRKTKSKGLLRSSGITISKMFLIRNSSTKMKKTKWWSADWIFKLCSKLRCFLRSPK